LDAERRASVLGEGERPADPDLLAFWQAARRGHPHLHRMEDRLENDYAVILLTLAEFNGPLCLPPRLPANRRLASPPPGWLEEGAGHAYFKLMPFGSNNISWCEKWFGEVPANRLDWHRAIRWSPRAHDPNAGRATEDDYGRGTTKSGYVQPYYYEGGEYREHDWARDHKRDHIGGTMQPIQGVPKFSPFHIGFDESFGGYNFGTGNAQFDFFRMEIDWACG
jgi:hypothetical protein